jgi:microcystin-dependent protein
VHVDSLFVAGKRAVDLETIYPVGSLYFNASNAANPASLFGFGTWVEFGPGRAVVCYNAAEAEFNGAEKTGGVKAHTLSAAEMPYHTHVQDAHAHSVYDPSHAHGVSDPGHNHAQSSHSHGITGVIQSGVTGVGRYEFDAIGTGPDTLAFTQASIPNANTNAATSGNVAAVSNVAIAAAGTGVAIYAATPTNQYAGGNVPHTNLQPFITCFVWKRTA